MHMPIKNRRFRAFGRATLVVSCLLVSAFVVTGCDLAKNSLKIDRSANMEFQDYRDALAPRASDRDRGLDKDGDIPELQPYIAQPSDSLRAMPLVSISVNQTVPLRDALFELANQAGYDIELDPNIRGSIIFTARQRPLDVVIERISDIAGLRYKFEGDTIRVEVDRPYHETYKIDYLNYVRRNQSSIRNDVSVVTGEGASTSTGSGFQAQSESEADFWGELNTGLTQIVGASVNAGALRTDIDPQITAAAQNPTAAPVEPIVTVGPNGETIVQAQPPQATLQIQSLPTDVGMAGDGALGTAVASGDVATFSLNRQAGIVSVYAASRTHDRVVKYLELLRRSVTSQVLIEAKVLEVSLMDEFAAGIDWMAMNLPEKGRFGFDIIGENLYPSLNTPQSPQASFVASLRGSDFNAAVQAISRFGTVHALASPRLTVLNNQSAALSVANNLVYFEIDIDVTRDEFGTQTQVDSSIRNVPEGVLINVQPSIDLNRQTISMSLRPTITRVIDYVPDPAVSLAVAQAGLNTNISSQIPVVNVQEFDSVINLESGQTMVLGGLLQDRTASTQQGVPVLSEVPLLGGLFRSQGDEIRKTELVVFLKATILDGSNQSIHATDRDLYKRFSGDRRPLDF